MLDQFLNTTCARFRERFNREPQWIAAAPGRVNLIGEHVDYNDGFVLPMAIDRYCAIVAASNDRENAIIHSVEKNDFAVIPLAVLPAHQNRIKGHWSNYLEGVMAGCRQLGMRPAGFDGIIESRIPIGSGLSSSAAIEVATATLIEAMTGTVLDPVTKALLCQKAEHEYAGVPCGIMDQFASVMCRREHLLLLDCRSRQIEHIPFSDMGVTVLIINTNVKHELSGGEYAERRAQCESAAHKLGVDSLRNANSAELDASRGRLTDAEFRRARHAISEIARTIEAASAVKTGDWQHFGQLMYASHESLRDDYDVSCVELDLLVKLAHDIGPQGGVFGSRMTGGGFGGCTVSLVETDRVAQVAKSIAESYQAKTGIEPGMIISRPAQGARIIKSG